MPLTPSMTPDQVLKRLQSDFKGLSGFDFRISDRRNEGAIVGAGGGTEFLAPGEDRNPTKFPTIELLRGISSKALPGALLGETLHHLGDVDPTFRGLKKEFIKNMRPEEMAFARKFYQKQVDAGIEKRPFKDFFVLSYSDSLIRGLIAPDERREFINQKDEIYSAEQLKIVARMKKFLRSGKPTTP